MFCCAFRVLPPPTCLRFPRVVPSVLSFRLPLPWWCCCCVRRRACLAVVSSSLVLVRPRRSSWWAHCPFPGARRPSPTEVGRPSVDSFVTLAPVLAPRRSLGLPLSAVLVILFRPVFVERKEDGGAETGVDGLIEEGR